MTLSLLQIDIRYRAVYPSDNKGLPFTVTRVNVYGFHVFERLSFAAFWKLQSETVSREWERSYNRAGRARTCFSRW